MSFFFFFLYLSLQRELGGEARAEELQSGAGEPHVEVLRIVPGDLLGLIRDLPGVCRGKASGASGEDILQSFQHQVEVSLLRLKVQTAAMPSGPPVADL